MEILSEDATYLVGGLAILGVLLLIAMRVTQQGKYLIWAAAALAVALLAFVVEQLWVTDSERIEQVVYELRDAVSASNGPAVDALLTPDVVYEQRDRTLIQGDDVREFIRRELERVHFDFVRMTYLETRAGKQSGRGSAEFRVLVSGTYDSALNFASTRLDFSLGFRETAPQVWKIDRITLTRGPRQMPVPGGRRAY